MKWNRENIKEEIRKMSVAGRDLSYNSMARFCQPLVSAAAYHFGSYGDAVNAAGIEYAEKSKRWTRKKVVALIRASHAAGKDLSWYASLKRKDSLSAAMHAAIRPRLFGSWRAALNAAGLDEIEIRKYLEWDQPTVAERLRQRFLSGNSMDAGIIQKEDQKLYCAATRYFMSYELALRVAGVNEPTE